MTTPETAPQTKEPFAYQAAKFALWAPFASLIVGCISNSFALQTSHTPGSGEVAGVRSAVLVLGVLSFALNAGAIAMGILALISMRKLGKAKILWRSVVGMSLASLFLAAFVSLAFGISRGDTHSRVQGTWKCDSPNPAVGSVVMTLQSGGQANIQFVRGDTKVDVPSTWDIGKSPDYDGLILIVKFDPSKAKDMGSTGIKWDVDQIAADHLRLRGQDADGKLAIEDFQRLAK